MLFISVINCNSDLSLSREAGEWIFSGHVIDGSTQLPIPSVRITYLDNDGILQSVLTDSSGVFFIKSLPYGDRNFQFTYIPVGATTHTYTQKILSVSGYSESKV
jgi:hypothetical protein